MRVFAGVLLAAFVLAAPAAAVNGNDPTGAWITDGSVYAVAATVQQVLVGGDFTLIGHETGSWVSVDASGAVPHGSPAVHDSVLDAVPDGARGWFLVTENEDEKRLLHVRADR